MALCPQLDSFVSSKMQRFIQDYSSAGIGHTHTYSWAEWGCISLTCLGDKGKNVSEAKKNSWGQKKTYSKISSDF